MGVILVGNPEFAGKISETLSSSAFVGIDHRIFPDGEVCPRLQLSEEDQLKGNHIVIAMQLELNQPKNQYLISLLWTIYNVKRHNPARISCIMPYHLYSRQDRETRKGEPISSKHLASALESAGIDDFITINSHTHGKVDIAHFFTKSQASDLSAIPVLGKSLKSRVSSPQESICLSPDEGALFLARGLAKAMNTPYFAAIQKIRNLETGEITQKLEGLSFELKNRTVIIIDDLVSSGKTMIGAAKIAKDKGAKEIILAYIHAVHSPPNFATMRKVNPTLIIATDTIKTNIIGLTTVSVVPLIGNWIEENS
ncbi:MAG: ribose-phosphate pyrophosphokinase [Candidatus Heimdallarchaeota archaeon]|nr:MAG: ribose-phosphate pyrophosphokinase [Candidatus Heimdallarchaeota archaeon]